MSYNLSLSCGCIVYVSCDPRTQVAHTPVIEARGARCGVRRHEVGLRLFLWELLPQRVHGARIEWDAWRELFGRRRLNVGRPARLRSFSRLAATSM